MTPTRLTVFAIAALACLAGAANAAERLGVDSMDAAGGLFVVTTSGGTILNSHDLVGAVIGLEQGGQATRLRIEGVGPDPRAPEGSLLLHDISIQQADGSWADVCPLDADGRSLAIPLAGRSRTDGTLEPGNRGEIEIVCTSDAEGKCIRLGFRPWEDGAGAAPMLRLYNACIYMVRADYAGNGVATTRNGMTIDVYDAFTVSAASADPAVPFEAGWDEHGAVCVAHPRVAENVTLAEIEAASTRLAGRTGVACTEAEARALGAILFNGSMP